MPSDIFLQARKAWFNKMDIVVEGGTSPTVVTYQQMLKFGGPREYVCSECAVFEWLTRISGVSQFKKHDCKQPKAATSVKARCATVNNLEWRHLLRNYNFALSYAGIPPLPGLKCLFVVAGAARLLKHGAHPGFMIWRKRMSRYQTTICDFSDIGNYNLHDYDFIVMPIHGVTPIISQKAAPPIFLYGHDHHKPDLQKRASELFAQRPAALLTPYPTIWRNAFAIHKDTRVLFAPYLSDPIWSEMNSVFDGRKFDVMVIGTAGPLYPERRAMHDFLKKQKSRLPFKLKLWEAPKPMPAAEKVSADKYAAPPLALWSKFLSQAKICVFGQDKFGYLVNKYAEVPGACSLMVAPLIPECQSVGLIANQNYVPLERPIQRALVPQLTQLLQQFDKHGKQIALRGLQWFQQRCSFWLYDHFWNEIETVLEGR